MDFEGKSSDKNDLEQLLKSRHLINHASGVITMLNQCIDMFGNFDLSPLIHVLHELGGRHYEYGVQPEHYPIVGKALLLTLETVLGNEDQWNNTPGVKESWTSIFGIISSAMLDGSHQRREMEQKLRAKIETPSTRKTNNVDPSNEEVVPLAPGVAPDEPQQESTLWNDSGDLTQQTLPTDSLASRSSNHPPKTNEDLSIRVASIRGNVRQLRLQRQEMKTSQHSQNTMTTKSFVSSDDESSFAVDSSRDEDTSTAASAAAKSGSHHNQITNNNRGIPNLIQTYAGYGGGGSSTSRQTSKSKYATSTSSKDRTSSVSYRRMIEQVQTSWDKIKSIPNYEEVCGTILFPKILEFEPEAIRLFTFADNDLDSTASSSLEFNPLYLAHVKAVIRMVDVIIHMLDDLELVAKALEELGLKHATTYGVNFAKTPQYCDYFSHAFLYTLEQVLTMDSANTGRSSSRSSWNAVTKEGWNGIFIFISTYMIRGCQP